MFHTESVTCRSGTCCGSERLTVRKDCSCVWTMHTRQHERHLCNGQHIPCS